MNVLILTGWVFWIIFFRCGEHVQYLIHLRDLIGNSYMNGFVVNIEELTADNLDFCRVLYIGYMEFKVTATRIYAHGSAVFCKEISA